MQNNLFYFSTLLLLLISAMLIFAVSLRGEPVVISTNLEKLPLQIAGYHGKEDSFSEEIYKELDADLHLYRHYYAIDGTRLSLYIGYYGTAKGGRTGHNPYACLPGAGWGVLLKDSIRIYTNSNTEGVDINFIVAGRDGTNNVMLHWYQTAGSTILTSGLQQNIERFKGRLLHNRNDGAYIQVSSTVSSDELPDIKKKLTEFVAHLIKTLPNYWPEES